MFALELGRKLVPKRLRPIAARIYWSGLKLRCPVCGYSARKFRALNVNPDFPESCPGCGSLARHRLIWLYLKARTDLFSADLKLLHFAAEACFERHFRRMANLDYTTADIKGGHDPGDEIIDVMNIPKPDNSFDVVLCIHVLQHVREDSRALSEIFRILKPGGWAILNSRTDASLATTDEVHDTTLPVQARKDMHANELYRVYGRDFKRRLEAAGFDVTVEDYLASLNKKTIERDVLQTSGQIYLCRKPNLYVRQDSYK